MRKYAILLFLGFLLNNGSFASAQSSVDAGLNWLFTNQNPDGSYGNQIDISFRDTEEVLNTFYLLNQRGSQYQSGLQWSQNIRVNNIDFVARKILLLSKENIETTPGLNLLLGYQNIDGGWGITSIHESDSIDTTLALQALKAINYSDQNIISSGLGYLINTQNPDGGWGFYPSACSNCEADPSNVYMTAVVSSTLQQFPQTASLATSINRGTDYLITHQNVDGGFGSSLSTQYETALAYIALVGVTTDVTILGRAANYLRSTQLANGSWIDDPYATALAIKALYLAENKPQPPPQPDKGTVIGKVLDGSTNGPLRNVSVTLESDSAINATTDTMGNFTLPNIPPGSQKILLNLTGYETGTASVNINAGSIINLGTILLSSNPTTGIVKGTVTDAANGQPLSGVTVEITGSFTGTATTGADGTFIFADVTPGAVNLTASKSGYYLISGSGTVVAGGILFFNPQLSASPPVATTGSLIGKVFDGVTKSPIQGASIVLAGGPTASTDAQGVFIINDIAPNTYKTTISAVGYMNQIYPTMIMAGVTTDMQTIYLTQIPQSTTVTGRITDASTGIAIVNADVAITETGAATKTSSDGSYILSGITLFEFNVKASATGYNTKVINSKTSAYGIYTFDITLNPSQVSSLEITSLATDNQEYGVNSPLRVDAMLQNTGATTFDLITTAQIIDGYGNIVALIHPSESLPLHMGPSTTVLTSLKWNTGKAIPGNYTIVLQVVNLLDGALLAEKATTFGIRPEVLVDATNLVITPKFSIVKKTETITISAWITNWSNIEASLTAEYEVRDVVNTVISSGTTAFVLPPSEFSKKIDIGSFAYTFNQSGQYPVKVTILSGGAAIATGSDAIHVAPAIRIEPSKSLNPDTVLPDTDKRIRINIQIKGVEDRP